MRRAIRQRPCPATMMSAVAMMAIEKRSMSGRMNGPTLAVTATKEPPRPVVRCRARSQKLRPSQPKMRPVSSPDVEKSQNASMLTATSSPAGNTSPALWRRLSLMPPATASPTPAALMARPSSTAHHAIGRNRPMPLTTTRMSTQSGFVSTSTRSPTLNTGPCPARTLWTMRKSI